MPTSNRNRNQSTRSVIKRLEEIRESRVILYFTGERNPQLSTQIAGDAIPLFKEILESFGPNNDRITLVLNTSGGHLEVPWPLVNLIREYCREFEVLVLEKALSAGTLIALGADRIIMLPYSQLSPIDPAADIQDIQSKQTKRIEIEDIIGYIDFAKEKIGIAEQNALAEIMKELTKEINPTLLGSINRTHSLIRRLARNLLDLHNIHLPDKQCKEIVENLTQKLYSHKHLINRREAKEGVGFGEIIEFADLNLKKASDKVFDYAVRLLELKSEFNPMGIMGVSSEKKASFKRALIYSERIKFSFTSEYLFKKIPDPSGQVQISISGISEKWTADSN